MPSRFVCLGILGFWLAVNGWLFFHDLLPRMLPGQPPPYVIDLVEEAQTRRPFIDWSVHHGDQDIRVFRARTRVEHDPAEHDVFHLIADFTPHTTRPDLGHQGVSMHGVKVRKMSSRYRVTSSGDLLGLEVQIEGSPEVAQVLRFLPTEFSANIKGQVEAGSFAPHLKVTAQGHTREIRLPVVKLTRGSAVLLPLHPVNRLQGLRPGQSWHVPVVDPLEDSLRALQGTDGEPRLLHARVRSAIESFSYGRRRDIRCLVIDYTGDDLKASTWVEQERGLVLCQEVTLGDSRWVMYRD